jgi:hypothetical protein
MLPELRFKALSCNKINLHAKQVAQHVLNFDQRDKAWCFVVVNQDIHIAFVSLLSSDIRAEYPDLADMVFVFQQGFLFGQAIFDGIKRSHSIFFFGG